MTDFVYFGHFYRMTVDGVPYGCRSTLEIINTQDRNLVALASEDSGRLLELTPNAVFIMLNPGGSTPHGEHHLINICADRIGADARSNLVRTSPDRTQNRLEKVMVCKQLNHVRVLNLFDIQEENSDNLVRRIKCSLGLHSNERIPDPPTVKPYSVFSCQRESEFGARLRGQYMVVVAWTVEAALHPFFRSSYDKLSSNGLQIHGMSNRAFFHPLLTKDWAKHVVDNWPNNS